jgi:hypothetical protein
MNKTLSFLNPNDAAPVIMPQVRTSNLESLGVPIGVWISGMFSPEMELGS